MKKKLIALTLALIFALCLFAGCDRASAPDAPPADPSPDITESLPSPDGETPSPQPEATPTPIPDPQPEITPPAEEPIDPASSTDVIYESETRPPDPASDTDLD